MGSAARNYEDTHLSLDEYNQLEEENNWRYEYHDGTVVAMAGGDPKHSGVASNMLGILYGALLSKDCSPLNSDTKYYVASVNKSYYPDVSVVCGPSERSEQDRRALTNPILLVEVLSESTAAGDRGEKFEAYSQLPSLREYVLIEQNKRVVQTYYRESPQHLWEMQWFKGEEATVDLRSLDVSLPLSALYRRTEEL